MTNSLGELTSPSDLGCCSGIAHVAWSHHYLASFEARTRFPHPVPHQTNPTYNSRAGTGWRWKRPLEVILPNLPHLSRATYSQLPSTMFRQLPNVSKDGGATASLFQCLTTLTVKIASWHSDGASCAHCLLSWPRAPLKSALLKFLYISPSGIFIHWWDPPLRLLLGYEVLALSAFPYSRCARVPSLPLALHWTLQYILISCVLGVTGLDALLQSCWIKRMDHLSWPAGSTLPDAAKNTAHLLWSEGMLLT